MLAKLQKDLWIVDALVQAMEFYPEKDHPVSKSIVANYRKFDVNNIDDDLVDSLDALIGSLDQFECCKGSSDIASALQSFWQDTIRPNLVD